MCDNTGDTKSSHLISVIERRYTADNALACERGRTAEAKSQWSFLQEIILSFKESDDGKNELTGERTEIVYSFSNTMNRFVRFVRYAKRQKLEINIEICSNGQQTIAENRASIETKRETCISKLNHLERLSSEREALKDNFKRLHKTVTDKTSEQLSKLDNISMQLKAKKEEFSNADWNVRTCDGCKRGEECEVEKIGKRLGALNNKTRLFKPNNCKECIDITIYTATDTLVERSRILDKAFSIDAFEDSTAVCLIVQNEIGEQKYTLESPQNPQKEITVSKIQDAMYRIQHRVLISTKEDWIAQLCEAIDEIKKYRVSIEEKSAGYANAAKYMTTSDNDARAISAAHQHETDNMQQCMKICKETLTKQQKELVILKKFPTKYTIIDEYTESTDRTFKDIKEVLSIHNVPKNIFDPKLNRETNRLDCYASSPIQTDGSLQRNVLNPYNDNLVINRSLTRTKNERDRILEESDATKTHLGQIEGNRLDLLDKQ